MLHVFLLMKSQYIESLLLSLGRTANGSNQVKGAIISLILILIPVKVN